MISRRWLLACIALLCCGCEADRFPIAPVSGQVLLNGKPLSGAHVLFQPVPTGTEIEVGAESIGRTDANGQFTLSTIEPERKGATIGKHIVKVTIQEEEDRFGGGGEQEASGPPRYTIPERYRWGTALEVEVPPEGADQVKLELTSP